MRGNFQAQISVIYMKVVEHVALAIGLSTSGKLDKEKGRATVNTVWNEMRKLMSIYTTN
jgi:hypothetical protein